MEMEDEASLDIVCAESEDNILLNEHGDSFGCLSEEDVEVFQPPRGRMIETKEPDLMDSLRAIAKSSPKVADMILQNSDVLDKRLDQIAQASSMPSSFVEDSRDEIVQKSSVTVVDYPTNDRVEVFGPLADDEAEERDAEVEPENKTSPKRGNVSVMPSPKGKVGMRSPAGSVRSAPFSVSTSPASVPSGQVSALQPPSSVRSSAISTELSPVSNAQVTTPRVETTPTAASPSNAKATSDVVSSASGPASPITSMSSAPAKAVANDGVVQDSNQVHTIDSKSGRHFSPDVFVPPRQLHLDAQVTKVAIGELKEEAHEESSLDWSQDAATEDEEDTEDEGSLDLGLSGPPRSISKQKEEESEDEDSDVDSDDDEDSSEGDEDEEGKIESTESGKDQQDGHVVREKTPSELRSPIDRDGPVIDTPEIVEPEPDFEDVTLDDESDSVNQDESQPAKKRNVLRRMFRTNKRSKTDNEPSAASKFLSVVGRGLTPLKNRRSAGEIEQESEEHCLQETVDVKSVVADEDRCFPDAEEKPSETKGFMTVVNRNLTPLKLRLSSRNQAKPQPERDSQTDEIGSTQNVVEGGRESESNFVNEISTEAEPQVPKDNEDKVSQIPVKTTSRKQRRGMISLVGVKIPKKRRQKAPVIDRVDQFEKDGLDRADLSGRNESMLEDSDVDIKEPDERVVVVQEDNNDNLASTKETSDESIGLLKRAVRAFSPTKTRSAETFLAKTGDDEGETTPVNGGVDNTVLSVGSREIEVAVANQLLKADDTDLSGMDLDENENDYKTNENLLFMRALRALSPPKSRKQKDDNKDPSISLHDVDSALVSVKSREIETGAVENNVGALSTDIKPNTDMETGPSEQSVVSRSQKFFRAVGRAVSPVKKAPKQDTNLESIVDPDVAKASANIITTGSHGEKSPIIVIDSGEDRSVQISLSNAIDPDQDETCGDAKCSAEDSQEQTQTVFDSIAQSFSLMMSAFQPIEVQNTGPKDIEANLEAVHEELEVASEQDIAEHLPTSSGNKVGCGKAAETTEHLDGGFDDLSGVSRRNATEKPNGSEIPKPNQDEAALADQPEAVEDSKIFFRNFLARRKPNKKSRDVNGGDKTTTEPFVHNDNDHNGEPSTRQPSKLFNRAKKHVESDKHATSTTATEPVALSLPEQQHDDKIGKPPISGQPSLETEVEAKPTGPKHRFFSRTKKHVKTDKPSATPSKVAEPIALEHSLETDDAMACSDKVPKSDSTHMDGSHDPQAEVGAKPTIPKAMFFSHARRKHVKTDKSKSTLATIVEPGAEKKNEPATLSLHVPGNVENGEPEPAHTVQPSPDQSIQRKVDIDILDSEVETKRTTAKSSFFFRTKKRVKTAVESNATSSNVVAGLGEAVTEEKTEPATLSLYVPENDENGEPAHTVQPSPDQSIQRKVDIDILGSEVETKPTTTTKSSFFFRTKRRVKAAEESNAHSSNVLEATTGLGATTLLSHVIRKDGRVEPASTGQSSPDQSTQRKVEIHSLATEGEAKSTSSKPSFLFRTKNDVKADISSATPSNVAEPVVLEHCLETDTAIISSEADSTRIDSKLSTIGPTSNLNQDEMVDSKTTPKRMGRSTRCHEKVKIHAENTVIEAKLPSPKVGFFSLSTKSRPHTAYATNLSSVTNEPVGQDQLRTESSNELRQDVSESIKHDVETSPPPEEPITTKPNSQSEDHAGHSFPEENVTKGSHLPSPKVEITESEHEKNVSVSNSPFGKMFTRRSLSPRKPREKAQDSCTSGPEETVQDVTKINSSTLGQGDDKKDKIIKCTNHVVDKDDALISTESTTDVEHDAQKSCVSREPKSKSLASASTPNRQADEPEPISGSPANKSEEIRHAVLDCSGEKSTSRLAIAKRLRMRKDPKHKSKPRPNGKTEPEKSTEAEHQESCTDTMVKSQEASSSRHGDRDENVESRKGETTPKPSSSTSQTAKAGKLLSAKMEKRSRMVKREPLSPKNIDKNPEAMKPKASQSAGNEQTQVSVRAVSADNFSTGLTPKHSEQRTEETSHISKERKLAERRKKRIAKLVGEDDSTTGLSLDPRTRSGHWWRRGPAHSGLSVESPANASTATKEFDKHMRVCAVSDEDVVEAAEEKAKADALKPNRRIGRQPLPLNHRPPLPERLPTQSKQEDRKTSQTDESAKPSRREKLAMSKKKLKRADDDVSATDETFNDNLSDVFAPPEVSRGGWMW